MSTHAEYLHEITEVVAIDHDHLSVTVKANSSVQPLTIDMMSDDHPGFAAGSIPPVIAQMFSICADHVRRRFVRQVCVPDGRRKPAYQSTSCS